MALRDFLRFIYKQLLPADLRQHVDIFKTLRLSSFNDFSHRRVVVLSPHPDDDILGCGGALHNMHLNGAKIMAIYFTDGRYGSKRYDENQLVQLRKEEAVRACNVIGIDEQVFFDNIDGALKTDKESVNKLISIINDFKAEAVFLPFFMDNHKDHMETNRIFFKSIDSLPDLTCYSYGVWSPLPLFNFSLDITSISEIKIEAIKAHKSQNEDIDLGAVFMGLNRYNAAISGRNGFSELFIVCSSKEYKRLMEVVRW